MYFSIRISQKHPENATPCYILQTMNRCARYKIGGCIVNCVLQKYQEFTAKGQFSFGNTELNFKNRMSDPVFADGIGLYIMRLVA